MPFVVKKTFWMSSTVITVNIMDDVLYLLPEFGFVDKQKFKTVQVRILLNDLHLAPRSLHSRDEILQPGARDC